MVHANPAAVNENRFTTDTGLRVGIYRADDISICKGRSRDGSVLEIEDVKNHLTNTDALNIIKALFDTLPESDQTILYSHLYAAMLDRE